MAAFELRPYQQECFDHAVDKNTIVSLPTGFGKTLIAARLISYYLKLHPDKKVAFLVPTRPLVEQQAAYCTTHSRVSGATPVVQKLVGQDQSDWTMPEWDESMEKSHILLGTAAVLQKAFVTDKFLNLARFSLIVFDECHNAIGNSPMAALMRDGVAPYCQDTGSQGPRILGLTASIVNGSLRNMEKKRRDLEKLLLSTIYCPNVKHTISDDRFYFVDWERTNNVDQQKLALEGHVEATLERVGPIKEIKKVVSRCSHVFTELGLPALFYYIDNVIILQIEEKARVLEEQDKRGLSCARRMLGGIPALRAELKQLLLRLKEDPEIHGAAPIPNKLEKLLSLVVELFTMHDDSHRGIVFVEQVALVSSLAKVMNGSLAKHGIFCGGVAGTGHQNENDRQSQLDKFKKGEIQLLVATATLEEGIDVSECAFVVRYTSIATTKAHIQGAGRARHPEAEIYYFENNPVVERQKEAQMRKVAKDTSLSLNAAELQSAISSMSVSVDQRHPYPFSSAPNEGQVSVFNCKQLFNQYCAMSLGVPVRPKVDLYRYANKPGDQKLLSCVRYPTPSGWMSISTSDYKKFWSGVDLEKIFSPDRVKKKSSSEKEEMCFVYLVVVALRENGLMDVHNQGKPSLLFDTKRNCSLDSNSPDDISIKNTVFQSYNHPS
jgi:endoribonuclease Dicer